MANAVNEMPLWFEWFIIIVLLVVLLYLIRVKRIPLCRRISIEGRRSSFRIFDGIDDFYDRIGDSDSADRVVFRVRKYGAGIGSIALEARKGSYKVYIKMRVYTSIKQLISEKTARQLTVKTKSVKPISVLNVEDVSIMGVVYSRNEKTKKFEPLSFTEERFPLKDGAIIKCSGMIPNRETPFSIKMVLKYR